MKAEARRHRADQQPRTEAGVLLVATSPEPVRDEREVQLPRRKSSGSKNPRVDIWGLPFARGNFIPLR